MIEKMKNDQLFSYLVNNSSLTLAQVDTILANQTSGSSLKRLALRAKRGVSGGSFQRSLRQGQHNIEASVFTLFLLLYVGFLDDGILDQLSRVGKLVRRASEVGEMSEADQVIDGIHSFVLLLSGKRKVIS
jgi:hypothetical protein